MEKSGILSLLDINRQESEMLLTYLRNTSNSPCYDFVNYLIGDDYLQFIDLLAGSSLKIPSRKNMYRDIEYLKIYKYVRDREYSPDSMRCVAKLYNKNLSYVKRAVLKMSKALKEDMPMSLEEFNAIKAVEEEKSSPKKDDYENELEGEDFSG